MIVRKEGFATLQTPVFPSGRARATCRTVLDPIRLEPGVSLSGTVVDPDGQPAEGVWVGPVGGFAMRSQFTRTDAAGKFTVRNLPKGMVEIGFAYGSLWARGKYLADGKSDGIKIRLRPSAATFAKPTTKVELEQSTMTEADFHRLWEPYFGREIEKVLKGH